MIVLLFNQAVSIKCYVCTKTDGNCKEGKTDCGSLLDKCLKVTNTKTKGVGKSCTNQFGCDFAKKLCEGKDCEVSCCDGELCNASINMKPLMFITILAPILAYFL